MSQRTQELRGGLAKERDPREGGNKSVSWSNVKEMPKVKGIQESFTLHLQFFSVSLSVYRNKY